MKKFNQKTVLATCLVLSLPISLTVVLKWIIKTFTSVGSLSALFYIPFTAIITTLLATFYIVYQVKKGNINEMKFPIILAAIIHLGWNIMILPSTLDAFKTATFKDVLMVILVVHLPSIIFGIGPVLYLKNKK